MSVLCPEYKMCSLNILPLAQAERIDVILDSTLVITPMSDVVANLLGSTFKIYPQICPFLTPFPHCHRSKPPPSDTLKSLLSLPLPPVRLLSAQRLEWKAHYVTPLHKTSNVFLSGIINSKSLAMTYKAHGTRDFGPHLRTLSCCSKSQSSLSGPLH